MKAWLHAEGHAVVSLFPFQIVFRQEQAAPMTEHNAHEVMRGAESCYPEYTWAMVKVPDGGGMFIVEGTQKKK
jgi:hypothetical protein